MGFVVYGPFEIVVIGALISSDLSRDDIPDVEEPLVKTGLRFSFDNLSCV